MAHAHINRIATCVPTNDVHRSFVDFAASQLSHDERSLRLFQRLSDLGGIEHRYSVLAAPGKAVPGSVDMEAFYVRGAFPSTAERMRLFETYAPALAKQAVDKLNLGDDRSKITHLIVTCCTGMSAPGLDLLIVKSCGLPTTVERTMVGFMGCYAAINGLRLARHIVRSEPVARVLVVNLELCSLHLQESTELEKLLSFYLFADGCAASLITAEPTGLCMDSFHAVLAPNTEGHITWKVGESGFDMHLSGKVPGAIRDALCAKAGEILRGAAVTDLDLWAVHPGGRTIIDAVQSVLELEDSAVFASREVLRRYGNMSSPTVVFVLNSLMESSHPNQKGCAMAFGPGLVAETMLFHVAA